jgi:uncharacterized protein DUF4440
VPWWWWVHARSAVFCSTPRRTRKLVTRTQVASAQISYGHSDGRVENKEQFINGVMTRKQTVKSLEFPELKIAVVGNAAIARHIYLAQSERDGKATTTKIGALQVWQKQDGAWKLLARQGFRLPA